MLNEIIANSKLKQSLHKYYNITKRLSIFIKITYFQTLWHMQKLKDSIFIWLNLSSILFQTFLNVFNSFPCFYFTSNDFTPLEKIQQNNIWKIYLKKYCVTYLKNFRKYSQRFWLNSNASFTLKHLKKDLFILFVPSFCLHLYDSHLIFLKVF